MIFVHKSSRFHTSIQSYLLIFTNKHSCEDKSDENIFEKLNTFPFVREWKLNYTGLELIEEKNLNNC